MKPNLFIIGAAKSGTTSLHHHLASHPDVFMSEPKEPGFFVPEADYYPCSEEWYLSLFEGTGGFRYRGEASTHYTKLPLYEGVVDRIAAFVDQEPRFIYLMRDPVDRALSHYWHNVRKFEEHRGILEALENRIEYRAFSNYRMQLQPYFERFGRERVLALTFESLTSNPRDALRRILEWLELDADIAMSLPRQNARPDSFTRVRGRGLLDRLARSDVWDRLSPLTPDWLKALGRRFGYQEVDPDSEPVTQAVRFLQPEMREQVEELEEFLGETFPEWTVTRETPRPAL